MRHIQGNTPEERFTSVDGLLDGMKKRLQIIQGKLGGRTKATAPFNLNGYASSCNSGEVICGYLSLAEINAKKAVIVIDSYAEKAELYVLITIVSREGRENSFKLKIKKGVNPIDFTEKINKGDRISLAIEYPESQDAPRGIWVAMRGDQLI